MSSHTCIGRWLRTGLAAGCDRVRERLRLRSFSCSESSPQPRATTRSSHCCVFVPPTLAPARRPWCARLTTANPREASSAAPVSAAKSAELLYRRRPTLRCAALPLDSTRIRTSARVQPSLPPCHRGSSRSSRRSARRPRRRAASGLSKRSSSTMLLARASPRVCSDDALMRLQRVPDRLLQAQARAQVQGSPDGRGS